MFEKPNAAALAPAIIHALETATHGDPFAVLGPHQGPRGRIVRAHLPGAIRVEVRSRRDGARIGELDQSQAPGVFTGEARGDDPYLLLIHWPGGLQETEDPYSFGLLLGDLDLHLIHEGRHRDLAFCLGAQEICVDGVAGVRFATWAPNARRVAVVGDFNAWDIRRTPMRVRHAAGVWEIFVPRLGAGERYKFAIVGPDGTQAPLKADPYARKTELPPSTASIVAGNTQYAWRDADWMSRRAARQRIDAPLSIYELHAGSWLRPQGQYMNWDQIAERVVPYVIMLEFTHVELMPLAEHPFGGSWGYQPLSLFAPTGRHGDPEGLARFVDACHVAGIGVILDWVPAHFPNDAHGMVRFDGAALYEYADPREGVHREWNTLIYNFARHEVRGFLIASALYWLDRFHFDGLRVDAVSAMLYRDYGRREGEWIPNRHGGRENLEAAEFLMQANLAIAERFPGVIVIAEESTAWPGVTTPVHEGGLGFAYKWNMGWMHDSLRYLAREPAHRPYHHNDITFGLTYAFSERYILPLSHDEVVHGKGALIAKMSGDDWRKRAGLRAFYAMMWAYPGKKLMFMGCEFAQNREWSHDGQLDWRLLEDPGHAGVLALVRDLNHLYRTEPALHRNDCDPRGFRWSIVDDDRNSVFAWSREADGHAPLLIVANLTPHCRDDYHVPAPATGNEQEIWQEILNTDASVYGGSDVGNRGAVPATIDGDAGARSCLSLRLPPLAALILRPISANRSPISSPISSLNPDRTIL